MIGNEIVPWAEPSDDQLRFGIVITAKMRHGDLWAAAKAFGSASALARHLGVTNSQLGRWINLKESPSLRWLEEADRGRAAAEKLLALCGKPASELWPPALRAAIKGGEVGRTIERHEAVSMRQLYESALGRLTLPSPEDVASDIEAKEALRAMLNKLSWRTRGIITCRYGLNGDAPLTLEETARVYKLTRERVRQIEAKAIRRLQDVGSALPKDVQHELASYAAVPA